jgi:YD repeat-containing protein
LSGGRLSGIDLNGSRLTSHQFSAGREQQRQQGLLLSQYQYDVLGQNELPVANLANVKGNRLLMQGDRHYDYDAYGNLIRERRGTGQKLVTEYRYDCQHRLIGVSLPGGSTASYKYDAFGRRIEKTVDGHTTEFLWQGERLIAESAEIVIAAISTNRAASARWQCSTAKAR